MERFHLDACLPRDLDGRARLDGAFLGQHREVDAAFGNRQGVAERDDRARVLGRHDAGDAGCAEHIALLGRALLDGLVDCAVHADAP